MRGNNHIGKWCPVEHMGVVIIRKGRPKVANYVYMYCTKGGGEWEPSIWDYTLVKELWSRDSHKICKGLRCFVGCP